MRILGIDIGSRSVKIAVVKDRELLTSKILDTACFYREYCKNIDGKLEADFTAMGLENYDLIVSTGYGRNNVNILGAKVITELKAHAFGAVWQTGLKDFVLLDIGGQDSKVIHIKNERMIDMVLNDKCAASCGRYLENMANILGISMETLETYSIDPVLLSSTCAVFGESELIGKIAEGYPLDKLAAGVNYSLFKRVKPLLERFAENTLVVTGGVAKNKAIIEYLKNETEFTDVIVPDEPQLNGALGCCAFGLM